MTLQRFHALVATLFFGAFNDNLLKQFVLLFALSKGESDFQGAAMAVFAIPFLLLSGYAGQVAERHSKTQLLVWAKAAEVAIIILAIGAIASERLTFLLFVLFLMGTQTALYTPATQGLIPELVARGQLVAANAKVQTAFLLAVFLGTAGAGLLLGVGQAWRLGSLALLVAVVGYLAACIIPKQPARKADQPFARLPHVRLRQSFRVILADPGLRAASLATSFFWFSGGIVAQLINRYGMRLLDLGPGPTSGLMALLALGTMFGCGLAPFAHRRLGTGAILLGAILVCGSEFVLYFYHLPLPILALALFLAASGGGLYFVPLAALIQSKPPLGERAEILAAVNFLKYAGLFLSGLVWQAYSLAQLPAPLAWWCLAAALGLLLPLLRRDLVLDF